MAVAIPVWAQRPNIIFILADDLGYGEVDCYNRHSTLPMPDLQEKGFAPTPNIDRLATRGIMMTQAYASPISSPTRTAFLTGNSPQYSGVYHNLEGVCPGLGPYRPSFVTELRQRGYRNAWFGKWHQGWDISNHPLNNGFEVAYGYMGGQHDYFDPTIGEHNWIGGHYSKMAFVMDGITPQHKMNYLTDEITDRALTFMERQDDRPFFIYLAYSAPHTPYQAPDSVTQKYLDRGVKDSINAIRCAMIDVMDRNIGRILDYLTDKGLDRNTLVVFMSDNGSNMNFRNGGLRGTKMTVWEGGIRVPMLVSWPGILPENQISSSICSVFDLGTTFLTLADPSAPKWAGDGVDLMPYWKGDIKGDAHEALVFSLNFQKAPAHTPPTVENPLTLGVRMGDWKLVRDKTRNTDALYNLAKDPSEQTDLSTQYPDKKNELLTYAKHFLERCQPNSFKIYGKRIGPEGDL